MRGRIRWRILLWPGLATLAMLAVLIGLGVWQVHRLAWKAALLAQIDRGEAAAPVPLGANPPGFAKVQARGRLARERQALYGAEVRDTAQEAQLGAQLVVPLIQADGPPVLVDLGWVPRNRPEPLALPPGEVEIQGYVRPAAHPAWFSAGDDVAARHFYTLDPARIGRALGFPQVAPFTLIALGAQPAGFYPDPARSLPRPPNNHLSYAVTWFGLAAALVCVFVLWAVKVIRA